MSLNPMIIGVTGAGGHLGAAMALFFGGGIYAILKKPLSVTPDPTDVVNQRYTGWRKKFTDEELEWLGDKRPTKAQEAAILAARRFRGLTDLKPLEVAELPEAALGAWRRRA